METDRRVLAAIKAAWQENGYAPTFKEIGVRTRVASSATVQAAILRLSKLGVVDHVRGKARTVRVVA